MAYINQAEAGPVTDKSLSSLYSRTFDKIVARIDKVPVEGAEFFAQEKTNLETHKVGEIFETLPLPIKAEDTEHIPLVSPLEGHNVTLTNVIYKLGMAITESAVRRQKTRLILAVMNALPKSALRKMEYMYASLFNGGFDTATTGDSVYVFSASHNDGSAETGTYSNVLSSAGFTTSAYFAAWLAFQSKTDARGFPAPQLPSQVVYPAAIHEDVMKVAGSDLYPQNSLNAKMPTLFKQFEPKLLHWLTSTTAWFVRGSTDAEDRGFICVTEEAPNYKPLSWGDRPDIIMGKRLSMSMSVGALHARDWMGNAGA